MVGTSSLHKNVYVYPSILSFYCSNCSALQYSYVYFQIVCVVCLRTQPTNVPMTLAQKEAARREHREKLREEAKKERETREREVLEAAKRKCDEEVWLCVALCFIHRFIFR